MNIKTRGKHIHGPVLFAITREFIFSIYTLQMESKMSDGNVPLELFDVALFVNQKKGKIHVIITKKTYIAQSSSNK